MFVKVVVVVVVVVVAASLQTSEVIALLLGYDKLYFCELDSFLSFVQDIYINYMCTEGLICVSFRLYRLLIRLFSYLYSICLSTYLTMLPP